MKSRGLFARPLLSEAFMLNGMRNFAQGFFDRARASGSAPALDHTGRWLAREEAIMGTAIRVELWSDRAGAGEAAIDAVMREMHRIDSAMSPFKPESELSRINREAALHAVPLTQEMFALLQRAILFSRLSDGAF